MRTSAWTGLLVIASHCAPVSCSSAKWYDMLVRSRLSVSSSASEDVDLNCNWHLQPATDKLKNTPGLRWCSSAFHACQPPSRPPSPSFPEASSAAESPKRFQEIFAYTARAARLAPTLIQVHVGKRDTQVKVLKCRAFMMLWSCLPSLLFSAQSQMLACNGQQQSVSSIHWEQYLMLCCLSSHSREPPGRSITTLNPAPDMSLSNFS